MAKAAKCPLCGEPLKDRSKKGKYYCENESCAVIYVHYPFNPAITKIVCESSPKEGEKLVRS